MAWIHRYITSMFYALLLGFPSQLLAQSCPMLQLLYEERPPYFVTSQGEVSGISGSRANKILQDAAIPYQWYSLPAKRQMREIKVNRYCACAVGWFKTKERESFARYSIPFYQDSPQIALSLADNSALYPSMALEDLFANRKLSLVIKSGYSYGRYLDEQLKHFHPRTFATNHDNHYILDLIEQGRHDYFFIAPKEAEGLIRSSGKDTKRFKQTSFSKMPDGEPRYFVCSKRLEEPLLSRIDQAIIKLGSKPQSP